MAMRSFLSLTLVALVVGSSTVHAKERPFAPVAQAGQEVRFSDGTAVLLTGNEFGNIAVSFIPVDTKSGLLRIWAENSSTRQFNISEASVTASSAGTPLVVMTYADQVKAQKRKEMWAAVATGLAAGLNSYAAADAGRTTYSGGYNSHTTATAYGSRGGLVSGSANTTGTFYGTSYNHGAAYMAQANAAMQNQAMFDRYQSMSHAAAQDLRERSLKANTLMPGQSVMGDIKIMLPKRSKAATPEMNVQLEIGGSALGLVFREGVAVMGPAPQAVATSLSPGYEPTAEVVAAVPVEAVPDLVPAAIASPPHVQTQLNSGAAMAKAYSNPSGPAARSEFVKLGCSDGFALISSIAGTSIFESTCGSGKRQLLECRGSGCKSLN